jgi:hypothetical protein
VSRSAKDDKKRGPLAYGKGTKHRAYGYEWNGKRLGGRGWREPGVFTKRETHRWERRAAKLDEREDAA